MASMGEGVIVVNAQRQIQLFNRAAQTMTGWDENSTRNLDYRTVLKLKTAREQNVSDNEDPFVRAWREQKTIVSTDLAITTQGGRKVDISLTASPIFDDKGQVTGGIALFRDISAEQEIDRQRNEFISTASHEMRTPIAAIEGYLSLAMNGTTATIDERAKGYLDKAHDSIEHLGALFKNLLVITKLEDKKIVDKKEYVNLSQLLETAVSDMQAMAAQKGILLQLTSGSQLVSGSRQLLPAYYVKVNPERLREVVMNLIENALKYTAEGRVAINLTADRDTVTISVADTGMGIAPEDLPHLFQKFYRIDNSATRTIGGTGLGLYIARTIIELYGGRIWADSVLGKGSSFNFQLPRVPSEQAIAMAPVAPVTAGGATVTASGTAAPAGPAGPPAPARPMFVPGQPTTIATSATPKGLVPQPTSMDSVKAPAEQNASQPASSLVSLRTKTP